MKEINRRGIMLVLSSPSGAGKEIVAVRGCARCRCLVMLSAAAMTAEGISLTALPENILPGMNADMSIEVMKKDLAILLPIAAVSNGHILMKKNKGTEKIPVVVGVSDSEYVEILSPELSLADEIFLPKENKK
jgi:hypothetical protein